MHDTVGTLRPLIPAGRSTIPVNERRDPSCAGGEDFMSQKTFSLVAEIRPYLVCLISTIERR